MAVAHAMTDTLSTFTWKFVLQNTMLPTETSQQKKNIKLFHRVSLINKCPAIGSSNDLRLKISLIHRLHRKHYYISAETH